MVAAFIDQSSTKKEITGTQPDSKEAHPETPGPASLTPAQISVTPERIDVRLITNMVQTGLHPATISLCL